MKPIHIITGIPGSGKNTQGKRLGVALEFPHVDIGDMLTEYLSSEDGFSAHMSSGPFPPERMIEVLEKKLIELQSAQGLILTHHFHTVDEIEKRNELYIKLGFKISRVFVLHISQQTALNRSLSRMGGVFNHKEPSHDHIQKRIEKYVSLSSDFNDYFRKSGQLVEIDGEVSADEVFNSIYSKITG